MIVYDVTFGSREGALGFEWRGRAEGRDDAMEAAHLDLEAAIVALSASAMTANPKAIALPTPRAKVASRGKPPAGMTPRWVIGPAVAGAFTPFPKDCRSGRDDHAKAAAALSAIGGHVADEQARLGGSAKLDAWIVLNRRVVNGRRTVELDRTPFAKGPGQWPEEDPFLRPLLRAAFAIATMSIGEHALLRRDDRYVRAELPASATLAAACVGRRQAWRDDAAMSWLEDRGMGIIANTLRSMGS